VLTHLVATGAVAVGDDMVASFAGGADVEGLAPVRRGRGQRRADRPRGRGRDGGLPPAALRAGRRPSVRIAAEAVEHETAILFRRELLGPGYNAVFIPVVMEGTGARALSFVADLSSGMMNPDLTRETQIRYAATGTGFLGSSYDYLRGVVDHLQEMAIPDPELDALLVDVEAEIARLSAEAG
jgi:hypothetical protein